jgi:phosphoglycerate dehydrogenase-like enzyme
MPVIVVEEDRVLRLVQVILDTAAPPERVAAFADFMSTDLPDFAGWLDALRADVPRLYSAEVRLVNTQAELREHLPTADVAIVESLEIRAAELTLAPKLALVQNFGMVTDNIDSAACRARGVAIKTLRRRTNVAMAEHTLMLILALAKRLPLIDGLVTPGRLAAAGFAHRPYDTRHTAAANFGRIPGLRTLHGMTLGLLGCGEIGREVAGLARAFGMHVIYNKRGRLTPETEQALGLTYRPFDELFATADFLSVHIPLSDETRSLVDRTALERMKPGAMLVNTSRAQIVEHDALVDALNSGRLGGAALDVLYKEPDREDEPLLSLPNAILTPHLGGGSRINGLEDAREMLVEIDASLRRV